MQKIRLQRRSGTQIRDAWRRPTRRTDFDERRNVTLVPRRENDPSYQLMITHVPGDENFTFSLSQSGSPHNSTANQAIAETDVIFVDSWLERLLEQFSGNS